MSKETYHFSHDNESVADPKMKAMMGEFKGIGYALFWRIVEMLHSDTTHKLPHKNYIYLALAEEMGTSVEQVLAFVQQSINVFELFESDGAYFWSNRVFRNMEKRKGISESRSEAGKKSAEMRKNSTSVQQNSTSVQQNSTKPNKGKEIKEKDSKEKSNYKNNHSKEVCEINISFDEFWNHYDKKTGDKKKLVPKWNALKDEERILAMEHVTKYKIAQPDKSFRKDVQTYLNNKSFNDEIIYRNSTVKNEQPTERLYTKQEQEQRAKLLAAGYKLTST